MIQAAGLPDRDQAVAIPGDRAGKGPRRTGVRPVCGPGADKTRLSRHPYRVFEHPESSLVAPEVDMQLVLLGVELEPVVREVVGSG